MSWPCDELTDILANRTRLWVRFWFCTSSSLVNRSQSLCAVNVLKVKVSIRYHIHTSLYYYAQKTWKSIIRNTHSRTPNNFRKFPRSRRRGIFHEEIPLVFVYIVACRCRTCVQFLCQKVINAAFCHTCANHVYQYIFWHSIDDTNEYWYYCRSRILMVSAVVTGPSNSRSVKSRTGQLAD